MIQLSTAAQLFHEDCRTAIKKIPDNSIDSCCTDPPYALVSIIKRFGSPNAMPAKGNDAYMRASSGFMGAQWDVGETAFSAEFWAEVYRVLKPGAFVAAFGASRGYHRMACAIEDAGFEIRDSLMWIYGVGFPKSHDVSGNDAFCQCAESATEREVRPLRNADVSPPLDASAECGEVLQPSVSQHGTQSAVFRAEPSQGLADGQEPGMEGRSDLPAPPRQLCASEICSLPAGPDRDGASGRLRDGTPISHGTQDRAHADANGMRASSRPQAATQRGNESGTVARQSFAQDGRTWKNCGRCGKPMVCEGLGTALKPAFEPIVLARKPLSEKTVAANVLKWRTGALNIDGCRVGLAADEKPYSYPNGRGGEGWHGRESLSGNLDVPLQGNDKGRWPANVVTDGSDEVVGMFPSGLKSGGAPASRKADKFRNTYGTFKGCEVENGQGRSEGSAARFFYSAKASKADRNGSKHPTVKPIALIQWLARLITPPGGTILDPFAGSGTTGIAAEREGFSVVLCEREAEYVTDIQRRFGHLGTAVPALPVDIQQNLIPSPPLVPPPPY